MNRILLLALSLTATIIKGLRIDAGAIVVSVCPHKRRQRLCPICGHRCEFYDAKAQPRRWRAMDLARSMCYLEYRPARVRCPEHGVHVEAVPWARHKARCTRDFEDWVAWLTVHGTISAVAELARIEWHSVGGICKRVYDDLEAARGQGRFEGLRRIGIDETSHKKGHRYLTVVVDHDRGCLIWAHAGYGKEVLNRFLDELTREQRRAIEIVTADGAKWIKALVKRRCPNAGWVMDPFHVVSWINDALDGVRREEWQVAKRAARDAAPKRERPGLPAKGDETPAEAKALQEAAETIKGSRYALVKNPSDLTDTQKEKLDEVRRAGSHLFKAWELKENLRAVFHSSSAKDARALLDAWLRRASRCRIPQVVAVNKKVRHRKDDIIAAVELGISNARVEAINNKIKVTVRMGYGFKNTDNLIALLMLRCSDNKPHLPGRPVKGEKEKVKKVA
ncbi:MAG: ISL3 family transposase [Coriobacteriales bacterium]|jgi:transposase|nr:ISL3 family transposase [Coriobacteriales bacterium]